MNLHLYTNKEKYHPLLLTYNFTTVTCNYFIKNSIVYSQVIYGDGKSTKSIGIVVENVCYIDFKTDDTRFNYLEDKAFKTIKKRIHKNGLILKKKCS